MSSIEDSSLPPASILAVDDHPGNLLALEAIFETLDIELVKASSGPQALKLAEQRPFAVILLDVVMPEMDGFEVLEKLRTMRLARETPIILLTAYEFDPRNIESLQGTALVDYIVKPIASGLLRAKVRALVSLYRRGEALAARDRDIAMLAHDLQTPLASIAAGTLLLSRGDLDERTRTVTDRIARTVKRMSEMVTDLTDYARAGLGPIPVVRRTVDWAGPAADIVAECHALDGGDRIRVETTGDVSGEWDANRLAQAISQFGPQRHHARRGGGAPAPAGRRRRRRGARSQPRRTDSRRPAAVHLPAVRAWLERRARAGTGALHRARDRERAQRTGRSDLVHSRGDDLQAVPAASEAA